VKAISFLKVAPAFLLAGTFVHGQTTDTLGTREIEQVVIVGYGKQKKSDLTGSVTAISAKDFNEGAITSPEQLIQGKTAGVQITTNGGAPGSGSVIRIRGGASLNASNDPLIVIDGVPVDNNEIKGAANPLALINPSDIESFNILKDASATAIYGSRAANGVIIITTKKGSSGRLKAVYSTTTSAYTKMGKVDVLTGDQFREIVAQYGSDNLKNNVGTYNTDWQEQIYQTALGYDNNLALSGGVRWLPYRLSLGYLNQEGILRTNSFERSTIGVNLSPKFFDRHLSVDVNFKGSYTENRFADTGQVGAAVSFDPTRPVYDAGLPQFGGYFEWTEPDPAKPRNQWKPVTIAGKNPLSALEQRFDYSYVTRYLGNVQLDYKFHFLPELRANLNVGLDKSSSNGSNTILATTAGSFNSGGSFSEYKQSKENKLLDFYLNYVKDIDAIQSTVDLTAGYSYQDFYREEPAYLVDEGTGAVREQVGFATQSTILSYFGRLNYSLMNRYLLTATLRRDGSSRFGKDNRVGYFPSVALAWRIDQEGFLKGSTAVSQLKLRAGWGETGQQEISNTNYPYLARFFIGDGGAMYQLGDQYYITYRPQGYDPNLKWETTETKNIGLDFGFASDRITGSVDLYQKDTRDLLSMVNVPAGANLTNILLTNVGNMRNRGIEASVNVQAIKTDNFSWEFSANATHYKSEITNLSATENPDQKVLTGGISGGTGTTVQVHAVGYQPNAFYVYQQVYGSDGRPLEGVYVDRNGDGIINNDDLYMYKSPTPDVLLGFSSRFTMKNWDLGFTMRASIGNYVYNNMASKDGTLQLLTDFDSKKFTNNIHSSFYDTGFRKAQYLSDYYVENGSFLRMDDINLGYNFKHFMDNARLRVFASAQNVFLITKYSGLDPEVYNGIDNNLYQRPRVYSVGLNFQF